MGVKKIQHYPDAVQMKILLDKEPLSDRENTVMLPVARDLFSALGDTDKEFLESHTLGTKQIQDIAHLALNLPKLYSHGYSSEEEYDGLKHALYTSPLAAKPQYQRIIHLLDRYTSDIKTKHHQNTWDSSYTILYSLILSARHTYFHHENKHLRENGYSRATTLFAKVKDRVQSKYYDLLLKGISDKYLTEDSHRQKKHLPKKEIPHNQFSSDELLRQTLLDDFFHIEGELEQQTLYERSVGTTLDRDEQDVFLEKAWQIFVDNHQTLSKTKLQEIYKEIGSLYGCR